jgi:alpha-tubulin suppressor-like RCC1 family protein
VQVHAVSGATAIACGRDHGIAIVAGGAVMTWGANDSGQLGDGTTTNHTTAITVAGVSGESQAVAGHSYTAVL